MVKLKYAPGVEPLRNEHCGCTFQNSRIGQTAMNGQKNDRARQSRQMNKKANLMQAVTNWRNLPPGSKTNWNNFATNYPQPCKNPDSGFLTGYQLFIKRQQYLFLNEGIKSEFLKAPFSEVLILDYYTFTVDQTENCLDVTENYIKNFGLIPSPGQFMLIKVLAYAVKSGQFFPVVTQTIEILESYIDGLFISLHLPVNCRETVFSVYLSKPVNQSVVYSGTKTRYMGCFTTKTFLQLTDTPDSYVGQAGKKVKVKADESGLEFVPDTGGGLTCETLPACPTIITINADIDNLESIITNSNISSLPPVKVGQYYNFFTVQDARGFAPPGCHVTTYAEMNTMLAYAGEAWGSGNMGSKLKEIGNLYWQLPNTGASNLWGFNLRGTSQISAVGDFGPQFQYCRMGLADLYYGQGRFYIADAGNTILTQGIEDNRTGHSYRFTLDNPNLWYPGYMVTGNDGKKYRTCKIGTQVFTSDNSNETKFRDGSLIPYISSKPAWAAMSTAGRTSYAFNPNYN